MDLYLMSLHQLSIVRALPNFCYEVRFRFLLPTPDWDGQPKSKPSLQTKFRQYFQGELRSSLLSSGSSSLHPVHAALRRGFKELLFNLDRLFIFEISKARREDYACFVMFTNVSAACTMKHTETRSLFIKYVHAHVLEELKNLKEYLLPRIKHSRKK